MTSANNHQGCSEASEISEASGAEGTRTPGLSVANAGVLRRSRRANLTVEHLESRLCLSQPPGIQIGAGPIGPPLGTKPSPPVIIINGHPSGPFDPGPEAPPVGSFPPPIPGLA